MTEISASRTKITFGCSREFKGRVAALAARRGKSIGDVIIDAMADELKFHEFYAEPESDAAADDWRQMAEEARARRGD